VNRRTRVGIGNSCNSTRLRTADYRNVDRNNLYNRPENRARNADRAQAAGQLKNARLATGKANNVFADKDGNVARKTQQGWQSRGQQGWEKPEAADVRQRVDSKDLKRPTMPSGEKPEAANVRQKVDSADLNRSAAARERGASVRRAGRRRPGRQPRRGRRRARSRRRGQTFIAERQQ